MKSSAKTGKKNFQRSQEHFLHKSAIWDRTPPPHLHIKCSLHVCGSVQGSQIFKQNSIILIRSKVMAFLLILLSPRGPCCPHVIPIIPMSSLSSPHHPHSPQKVPMWSPWLWSLWSPCHPCQPTSSPCHLEGPHIIPNPQTPTPPTPHPPGGWGP